MCAKTADLTELIFGMSRKDNKPLIDNYMEHCVFASNPFETLDRRGVGSMLKSAVNSVSSVITPTFKVVHYIR